MSISTHHLDQSLATLNPSFSHSHSRSHDDKIKPSLPFQHSPSLSPSPNQDNTCTLSLDQSVNRQTSASGSAISIESWLNQTCQATSPSTPPLDKVVEKHHTNTQDTVRDHSAYNRKRKRPSSSPGQSFTTGISPIAYPQSLAASVSLQGTLPLTKRFLSKHNNMSASRPGIPPTFSSESTSSAVTPKRAKLGMTSHNILRNDAAFNDIKYSSFKKKILSEAAPERHSGIQTGATANFRAIYQTCIDGGVTEATFKREILKHIIMDEFQVLAQPGDPAEGIQPVYASRNTLMEGIFSTLERPLRRGFLPHNFTTNQYNNATDLAKALKADGITNSIPDATWGYLESVLGPRPPGITLPPLTKDLLTVCPSLQCPFLFLEVKLDAGSYLGCCNQAGRAGAIFVCAMRQLLAMTGRKDILGADVESYLYCATTNEDKMEWWVHWAEVHEGNTVSYHMNRLRCEYFESDDSLLVMRRYMHNMIEWGMTTRLPEIQSMIAKLYEREALLQARNK